MSRGITLYLHVHQPWRVRRYSIFDVAARHDYFETNDPAQNNELIFHKVAEKSYLRMNALLEELLRRHRDFKLSLSISGVFLEQAERFNPAVIESFKRLVATGKVELVSSPYYHSLAFFYSRQEFEEQIRRHRQKLRQLFGVETRVLANTELAYNNDLAKWAENAGFRGMLAEGWDEVLDWRSPNYVYRPVGTDNRIGLLLKNYRLSDDIAFRFSNRSWAGWPLTAEKYRTWLMEATAEAPLVNLFMDYETFGEHQWSDSGIFSFFDQFVASWLEVSGNTFYTVSEALAAHRPVGEISMPETVTWADSERDLTAWNGNDLQKEALRYLYELEADVLRSGDEQLIADWRRLQTSDHFYYMCTKWFTDGDVHAYFSPYNSPYEAFLYYVNAIRDVRWRLSAHRYERF